MSEVSRSNDGDREAAPSRSRSRWDRSPRDNALAPARYKSDDNNDSRRSPPPRQRNTAHTDSPDTRPTEQQRRFSETKDIADGVSREGSQYGRSQPLPTHSVSTAESRFQNNFPYKDDGASDDNSDDNLRDEALEHHYREYEAECKALAMSTKQTSPDSEPNKRAYSTAFAPAGDQDPSLNEPHQKKPGFAMTMGSRSSSSSQGGSALTALQPQASGFGFSMAIGKSKPFSQTFSSLPKKPVAPIKMSLGIQKPKAPTAIRKPMGVANVFNDDDDSDEEEMPPEAKMRMRNLGRETPTAAGPNSFGKGNLGFCDRHKIIQRELQKKMDEVGSQK